MRLFVSLCACLSLSAATAAAQSPERGYVQGLGGVATTAVTDSLFAGAAAVRATGRLDVFGELGHLRNGIWKDLNDELDLAEEAIRQSIETQFGVDVSVSFDARVPVWYGLGGARIRGPRLRGLDTYAEVGIGFARLRPEVELEVAGERLDAEAGRLLSLEDERSELMSATGAGVAFRIAGPIRIEAGYRFSRIYGERPINVNRVHAGVGYSF